MTEMNQDQIGEDRIGQDQIGEDQVSGPGTAWRLLLRVGFAVIVVALIIAYGMIFGVREGTNVVVTQFGKPVGALTEAGVAWKWPWPIEQKHEIDVRLRFFNTPFTATFTRDQKNIVLLTYVIWKVEDPLLFFQSVGTLEKAQEKLNGMVTAGKNFHFGSYDLTALVSTTPEDIKTEQIEQAILRDVQGPAMKKFGIAVQQIGIKRIAYEEANMESVLAHMRAERKAKAGELRAKGDKEAEFIRNDALVRSEEIRREGREKAGEIVGRAEKEATVIYNRAIQLDEEFYRFWRSLQTLRKTLRSKATIVLRNDRGPFNLMFDDSEPNTAGPNTAGPGENQPPAGTQRPKQPGETQ